MLDSWIDEARQFAGSVQPSVIIVGCKLDLVDVGCRRVVSAEDAQKKAESLGALYTETSSKHAVGVEETFRILCQDILTRVVKGDISVKYEEYKLLNSIINYFSDKTDSIKIGPTNKSKSRSGSLCWSPENDEHVTDEKRGSCCF